MAKRVCSKIQKSGFWSKVNVVKMNSQPMDEKLLAFFEDIEQQVRKYAPYFSLSKDKQQNEFEVVYLFNQELKGRGVEHFDSITVRGPGKDPPDCEAIGNNGERIGIEVTELVDGDAIASAKNGKLIDHNVPIPLSQVIEKVSAIVSRKDRAIVKGGPYDLYKLIIYCDDPEYLDFEIHNAIRNSRFGQTKLIDHAYFFESYDPWKKCCPYIELRLD